MNAAAIMVIIWRFRPLRTAAQTLAATLALNAAGLLGLDWSAALSLAGAAGLLAFLQIWAEGGNLLADDPTLPRRAIQDTK